MKKKNVKRLFGSIVMGVVVLAASVGQVGASGIEFSDGADENDDAQDDGKQEGIRQPSVDHANAAVGEFLEHRLTLL